MSSRTTQASAITHAIGEPHSNPSSSFSVGNKLTETGVRNDRFELLLPQSVQQSLTVFAAHRPEQRRYTYTEWKEAITDDVIWNEAQEELLENGRYMCNDRQMWCQTIIESESNPSTAFTIALNLNSKYMLDALDPCSIMGLVGLSPSSKSAEYSVQVKCAEPRCSLFVLFRSTVLRV